jgi:uncharacterized protein (UPF0248 family)
MVYPREVLNRLKWDTEESIDAAKIWYVHRGAPGDVLCVKGSSIRALDRGFFETDDASIPYHRITRIECRGVVMFDKESERLAAKNRL